ncbi:flagellar basal-body rod protein FlgG [Undibacterium sp. Ji49W]|uniref:flagellar basal-body rod protein FlgG n=1 Tax=Undibacterium sp. Ji49W TaxID=3413040 RepID=UPI003BF092A3
MFDALYIGATGMQAQQTNVDTIANNLANANTNGFKKSRVTFSDMMVPDARLSSQVNTGEALGALMQGGKFGAGVSIASMSKLFDSGELKKTESAFDIAIQGDGFLEVVMPDNSIAYSRGGTLKINKDGQLALQGGQVIKPGITIPEGTQTLSISADGKVQVRGATQSAFSDVGQLELVHFASPGQLNALGDNLYKSSEYSGEAVAGVIGENGIGTVMQGYVEASNVKMLEEMISLMIAQRAYEANVKIVQASDEMLGLVNNLRK